jgi:hypothetical protein
MAKKFLNAADIGAAVEQMSGKSMAQGMRARSGIEPCLRQVLGHQSAYTSASQTRGSFIKENRRLVRGLIQLLPLGQPLPKSFQGLRPKQGQSLSAAFSANRGSPLIQVEVFHI